MLPEPGMSCSVCHLHLTLFYLEMYERNKMMNWDDPALRRFPVSAQSVAYITMAGIRHINNSGQWRRVYYDGNVTAAGASRLPWRRPRRSSHVHCRGPSRSDSKTLIVDLRTQLLGLRIRSKLMSNLLHYVQSETMFRTVGRDDLRATNQIAAKKIDSEPPNQNNR